MGNEQSDIYGILMEMVNVIKACNRILETEEPSEADVAIVQSYVDRQRKLDEWIDEEWEDEIAQLPKRILYIRNSDDPQAN